MFVKIKSKLVSMLQRQTLFSYLLLEDRVGVKEGEDESAAYDDTRAVIEERLD